jgi:hypothetical protein
MIVRNLSDQRLRKVVPVMYQRCQLPPELTYYFWLDYSRAGKLYDFWTKLHNSIHSPSSVQCYRYMKHRKCSNQHFQMHVFVMQSPYLSHADQINIHLNYSSPDCYCIYSFLSFSSFHARYMAYTLSHVSSSYAVINF